MSDPFVFGVSSGPVVRDDQRLCIEIGRTLQKHYPGWTWHVDVPPGQNIVTVQCPDLSARKPWGFVLHKTNLYSDPSLRSVVRAGGELLERYRKSREVCRVDDVTALDQLFARPDR